VEPTLESQSDASLVIAVAKADQRALEEIYRRHSGVVFGLANRLLRNQAPAEEIVQEIFVRLWNEPSRYDPERGSLRSFLCAQAHSRTIDYLRAESARRRRHDLDAATPSGPRYDVEAEVVTLLAAETVRVVVAQLPPNERRAIELAYFQGMTYREVAEYLDEPEGTIKSRIRNGLSTLHLQLARAGFTRNEVGQ
jgi:RNA polymerase sigma-70 factor (ECF subfamily)